MTGLANDVLSRKEPMSPTEASHVVQDPKVQYCCLKITTAVGSDPKLVGSAADEGQELSMWKWSVRPEAFENVRERVLRHRDL